MNNLEKWKDILITLKKVAIKNGVPCECTDIICKDCDFENSDCNNSNLIGWLIEEYEEPRIQIPKDTPKDTRVLVSTNGTRWLKRYLAYVEDDICYCYCVGRTSWSSKDEGNIRSWRYVKLADEGEVEE